MGVRALVIAAAFAVAFPASALGVTGSYMAPLVGGVTFTPLINSGDVAFGDTFEGLPDGIGIVPGPGTSPTSPWRG